MVLSEFADSATAQHGRPGRPWRPWKGKGFPSLCQV